MARIRTGLQLRIAATIAGIVLVAVAALGVAVHQLLVLDRVNQARSNAEDQLRAAIDIYDQTGVLSFDAKVDDSSLPRVLLRSVSREGARSTLVRGGSTRTVWAAGRTGSKVLSTRTRVSAVDAAVRSVDRALLLAGVATVVLATLVGLLSASRLARRLRLAARTAREVTGGGDPHTLRSVVGRRRDEVGDLADAVDAMARRLNLRLQGEQRFTADVAHDLRTPVTGLITAAALLDESRPAQLVRDRAGALRSLVEELLEVSRLDRGNETPVRERVDLAETVTRAVQRGIVSGEYPGDMVRVRTESGAVPVDTDPRRLGRVLSNLVRNSAQHGAAPIEVTQEGRTVTVTDHGPGFEAAMLVEGPQRFRRGEHRSASGNGLGLVIAAGQVALIGGTMRLSNTEDGGACVRVSLPESLPEPHDQVTDRARDGDGTGFRT